MTIGEIFGACDEMGIPENRVLDFDIKVVEKGRSHEIRVDALEIATYHGRNSEILIHRGINR